MWRALSSVIQPRYFSPDIIRSNGTRRFSATTSVSSPTPLSVSTGRLIACYQSIIADLTHRNPNIDQLEQLFSAGDNRIPAIDDSATGSSASTCSGDIFSVLNADCENNQNAGLSARSPLPVPWPRLQISNVTMGCTSYWWCNQSGGGPMRAMTHSGGLNKTLFNALFSQTALHARHTDWKK